MERPQKGSSVKLVCLSIHIDITRKILRKTNIMKMSVMESWNRWSISHIINFKLKRWKQTFFLFFLVKLNCENHHFRGEKCTRAHPLERLILIEFSESLNWLQSMQNAVFSLFSYFLGNFLLENKSIKNLHRIKLNHPHSFLFYLIFFIFFYFRSIQTNICNFVQFSHVFKSECRNVACCRRFYIHISAEIGLSIPQTIIK